MSNFTDFIKTGDALKTDGIGGRVFRQSIIGIDDGTNENTLKCTVWPSFNGDTISETDNIAPNTTTGNFSFNEAGTVLTVENAGLSGSVVCATGILYYNASGSHLTVRVYATGGDINIAFYLSGSGAGQGITALVNSGIMYITIDYITNA